MSPQTPRANRGPAAAAANRRAVLVAARRLFAQRGYHVPLSAVAQEAGVGQGVLYRHFPTRLDLAFAVFEENLVELERLVENPDADTFAAVWRRLVDLTVDNSAFVEMAVDARRSMPDYEGAERLRGLIQSAMRPAQRSGRMEPNVTVEDILLAHRMIYGIVATAVDPDRMMQAIGQAERLLSPRLALPPERAH